MKKHHITRRLAYDYGNFNCRCPRLLLEAWNVDNMTVHIKHHRRPVGRKSAWRMERIRLSRRHRWQRVWPVDKDTPF